MQFGLVQPLFCLYKWANSAHIIQLIYCCLNPRVRGWEKKRVNPFNTKVALAIFPPIKIIASSSAFNFTQREEKLKGGGRLATKHRQNSSRGFWQMLFRHTLSGLVKAQRKSRQLFVQRRDLIWKLKILSREVSEQIASKANTKWYLVNWFQREGIVPSREKSCFHWHWNCLLPVKDRCRFLELGVVMELE